MYWEGSGKISKLKKTIFYKSHYICNPNSSKLLLQPQNLYTGGGVPPEQSTRCHYGVEVGIVDYFQRI
jgi:hypothetical protein